MQSIRWSDVTEYRSHMKRGRLKQQLMLQLKDLKVQNQDRSGSTNQSCWFWMWFDMFDSFVLTSGLGMPSQSISWNMVTPFRSSSVFFELLKGSRCIEKVEEAQGNTLLTKKLDLWSLWFPFVVLMSLPCITISTFYLFHSSMFFPFPFLPDRSWSTWPRRTADGLVRHFGSLVTSMNTLFKAISGGVTWEDPAEVLFEVGAEWVAVFTFYIAFCCY